MLQTFAFCDCVAHELANREQGVSVMCRMKSKSRLRLFTATALLLFSLARKCHGFPSQRCSQYQCLRSHSPLLQSTNNNLNIDHDEFESLVETHPLDDPEPSPSESQRAKSLLSNNNNIPVDSQQEWEWFYSKLKQRNEDQQQKDTIALTNDMMEESLLRHWMAKQRKAFMKTLGVLDLNDKENWGTPYLSRPQKELLDAVGFSWGHLQPPSLTNDIVYSDDFQRNVRLHYKDWQWNAWYERLRVFQSQYGHTHVQLNGNDDELARWTAEQRELRRTMPERRRQRLDELQFDWDWKDNAKIQSTDRESLPELLHSEEKSQKGSFARHLKELKQYRSTNGDCNVPLDHPGGLGQWVQRMKGQRSKLSPSSIQKLEAIGLVFLEDEEE